MYSVVLSVGTDSFSSSFLNWMPFASFPCLNVLARTSSTMLDESGVSRNVCFISNHKEKAFHFAPLNMILAFGLSYVAFIKLSYSLSTPTFS